MKSAPPSTTTTLTPPAPLSWEWTLRTWYDDHRCLLCRTVEQGLWRVVEWEDRPVLLHLSGSQGTVEVAYYGRMDQSLLCRRASRLLNLHWDRQGFLRLAAATPLALLARRMRGLTLVGFASRWEGVVACLVSQQLSLSAALSIRNRLAQTFGQQACVTPQGLPLYTLPPPEEVAEMREEALRAVGLSRPKARHLRELARLMAEGEFPSEEEIRHLPRERAVERLRVLPGLGEWSANYLMVRAYGHPDGFPASDAGLLRNLMLALGMEKRPTPAQAEELAAPFAGQRSLLTALLWTCRRGEGDLPSPRC